MEFRRFPTQMNIPVLSRAYQAIEPLAFHRAIVLLRTDRDHEQKLVRPRLFALSQSRSVPLSGFRTISAKYSFLSELVSLLFSVVHFYRQLPRYFAVTICLPCGFLRCSLLKTGRARISLMRVTFLDNASRLPFPEFEIVPGAS